MIEHDHGDQIPAFLLRSSYSARKFIEGPWPSCVAVRDWGVFGSRLESCEINSMGWHGFPDEGSSYGPRYLEKG
jgi:hypothetical protein